MPEDWFPVYAGEFPAKLAPDFARGDGLERIDEPGWCDVGRGIDQEMHMVWFAVHFGEFAARCFADPGEDHPEPVDNDGREGLFPVLRHENYVEEYAEYAMRVGFQSLLFHANYGILKHGPTQDFF